MLAQQNRLRKHADFQRVYKSSRKQFSKQMSFFFALRPTLGPNGQPFRGTDPATPRVGLTVGKVLGKAHDRNRIKRRLRDLIRRHLGLLSGPLDVILHPRRSVLDLDHATLDREIAHIFRTIQKLATKQQPPNNIQHNIQHNSQPRHRPPTTPPEAEPKSLSQSVPLPERP